MNDPVRRRHERISCDIAVWVRAAFSDQDFQLAEIQNISAGGFLVLVDHDFPIDQEMEISIEIPQRGQLVSLRGAIRHSRQNEDGTFLVGLSFSEVEGMSVPAFMEYIRGVVA